jgi:hypothetical protein
MTCTLDFLANIPGGAAVLAWVEGDPSALAVAAAGLFLAGGVKGLTGLGYATTALPFLVLAFGLETAMALVTMPTLATCLSLAISAGRIRETLADFRSLYIAMLPGIAIGVGSLVVTNASLASRLLGTIMIAYVALSMAKPVLRLSSIAARRLQAPVGLANGIVTGLTGSQVMPLLPYVLALELETEQRVQVINLAVTIASLAMVLGLLGTGVMTMPLLAGSLAGIVPAVLGVAIGDRVRKQMPEKGARTAVLLVLMAMGIALVARG